MQSVVGGVFSVACTHYGYKHAGIASYSDRSRPNIEPGEE